MIKDIIKILDQRRAQIRHVMQTQSHVMDLGKQHQLFGAYTELNMIIRTMQYQHEQWLKSQHDLHKMSRQTQEEIDRNLNDQIDALRENTFRRDTDTDDFRQQFEG
ncbi:MAG: hypothetical protein ACOCWQ_06045 [Nanoarchaeota archaeon]